MPSNHEIEKFLTTASKNDDTIGEILNDLRQLVHKSYPEATEEMKYGGIQE